MNDNSRTLFKLVSTTSAVLLSVISIVSCKKPEKPENKQAEKKAPPIVATQKIERKEPTEKTLKEADLGTKLIRARGEKRKFFDTEIIKAERAYKQYDPSLPQIDPTVKAEPAREFALATWQFLKNEEVKLNSKTRGAERTAEINETNITLAKAKAKLKNAEQKFDEVKDMEAGKRAEELKINPYYGLTPNPFQSQTPDNKPAPARSR